MVTFLWTRRNIRAPPLGTLFWVVRGVCLSYHALLRHCCLDLATDDLGQRGAVLRGSEPSLWLSSTGLAAGDLGRLTSGLVDVHVQPVTLPCCTLGKTQNGSYFFFLLSHLVSTSSTFNLFITIWNGLWTSQTEPWLRRDLTVGHHQHF